MFGKDSLELTRSTRSVDVANNSDDDHRRGFDDGDGLDNLLLVHLRSRLVNLKLSILTKSEKAYLANNMGHSSLISEEGGKVDRLGSIILGEGLYFSAISS